MKIQNPMNHISWSLQASRGIVTRTDASQTVKYARKIRVRGMGVIYYHRTQYNARTR